jgi:hypothetical protein
MARLIERLVDPLTGEKFKMTDLKVIPSLAVNATKAPKVWLALGNKPLHFFTHRWGIELVRGYLFQSPWGKVVPTYSPLFLTQGNFHLSRLWQHDFMKAVAASRDLLPILQKRYSCNPNLGALLKFIAEYEKADYPPLAFDIETPHSDAIEKDEDVEAGLDDEDDELTFEDDPSYTILQISFSFKPLEAISVPWIEPYITYCKKLLAMRGWKLVHNKHFDPPRLVANGVTFGGPLVDGMDLWHFLEPSWPAGLKKIAPITCPDMHYWRDESKTNPAWYNAADSDVLLRTYLYAREKLENQGRWEAFYKQYIELAVVLQSMSELGVKVDPLVREEGKKKFVEGFTNTVSALQEVVPIECRKLKVFKSSEEKLKKEGKWQEGRMVRISISTTVPKKTWYALDSTSTLLWKGKARGMEQARLLATEALGQESSRATIFTCVKPPKSPSKRAKRAVGADQLTLPDSTCSC